jgi:hypothetical protein
LHDCDFENRVLGIVHHKLNNLETVTRSHISAMMQTLSQSTETGFLIPHLGDEAKIVARVPVSWFKL